LGLPLLLHGEQRFVFSNCVDFILRIMKREILLEREYRAFSKKRNFAKIWQKNKLLYIFQMDFYSKI
jgi:hypothetical protein